jgi:hypothetical protein
MKTQTRLWIGVGGLILLSPLGLWLPELFRAGDAWGEWAPETLKQLVGYIPAGLERWVGLWKAPLQDYAFAGWGAKGLPSLSLAYLVSAVLGVGLTVVASWCLARYLAKDED